MSRWELGSRRDLRSTESRNSLLPVPDFGNRTGMAWNTFDLLLASIRFSKQRKEIERSDPRCYRWGLVQDAFNEHRAVHVSPSEVICDDKSISRWYGLGGDWIEKGLPHYVAID